MRSVPQGRSRGDFLLNAVLSVAKFRPRARRQEAARSRLASTNGAGRAAKKVSRTECEIVAGLGIARVGGGKMFSLSNQGQAALAAAQKTVILTDSHEFSTGAL